jgi:hypothetical protein
MFWHCSRPVGGQYDARYAGHEQRCPEVRSVLACFPDQPAAAEGRSGGGQYRTVQGMSSDAGGVQRQGKVLLAAISGSDARRSRRGQ